MERVTGQHNTEELQHEVQTKLIQLAAHSIGENRKIGIIETRTGLAAIELNQDVPFRSSHSEPEIYPGISDPKVGVPNPAASLPDLAIDDTKITPAIERYEKIHGMTKDQPVTLGMVEAAVEDEKLSVGDREKFKALLPNFMYYQSFQLNPFGEPYITLETARAIDAVSVKYDKFEKSVEASAPEALRAYKYVQKQFDELDHLHKGSLNSNDYENALLNPNLEASGRKYLMYALDHKYFGRADDVESRFFSDVIDGRKIAWNKGWYYTPSLVTPYHSYRLDLDMIRSADCKARTEFSKLEWLLDK